MSNIEAFSKIHRETLNGQHYFQSLLEAAYRAQLLSQAQLETIQFGCLALLAKKTDSFNGGDSSSILIEKAQGILSSLLFTIGVALKAYPSPDDAVAALQSMGVDAIYTAGRKQIDQLVAQAKLCHKSLVEQLLQSENVFYSSTVIDGINGFFKLYNGDFAAQEIHITADYPVYNQAKPLLGIEFILQYLEQLHYENLFCTYFSHEDIHHLLCGYDEQYAQLLINLYEPVLAAALGCALADVPVHALEITPEIQSFLHHYFAGKTHDEIELLLRSGLVKLAQLLSFPHSLTAYVQQSLHQLAVTIEGAMKTGNLASVFLVPMYPEHNPKLTISYGEKMDNVMYRKVLAAFMDSPSMADKISILHDQIHSLADLEDLLLDAGLCSDELMAILKSLNPVELVALIKKYRPLYEMSFTELRDCEAALCQGLNAYVSALPLDQQALLEQAIRASVVEAFE